LENEALVFYFSPHLDSDFMCPTNPNGGVRSDKAFRELGRLEMGRAILGISAFFFFVTCFGQGVPEMSEPDRAQVREDMTHAASLLWSSISGEASRVENLVRYSRQDLLSLSLHDEARRDWVYWPRERVGLPLQLMSAEQRVMVQDLLTSILSASGYLKVVHIMQLEQILAVLEDLGLPRGVHHYVIALFGRPSMVEPWAWRFEGHHVSLSVTVSPDGVRVTPSFLGADPAETITGPLAGFRPLHAEEDLGRQLIRSMSQTQQAQAILSAVAPQDIFSTNLDMGRSRNKDRSIWDDWRNTLKPEGISVSSLGQGQQKLVRRILEEVVTRYRPEISMAYLESVNLKKLSFAWMGSLEKRSPHYYRIQGVDFVFEYDNVQDGGNHIHSVWRSLTGDFGDDILGQHYRLSHAQVD